VADIQKLLGFSKGIEYPLDFVWLFLNLMPPEFFGVYDNIGGVRKAKPLSAGFSLSSPQSNRFCWKPLDKDCLPAYNRCVQQKTVPIRVRKETREKLHSIKNPGQTLDGIITQMIELWEKVKKGETVAAEG